MTTETPAVTGATTAADVAPTAPVPARSAPSGSGVRRFLTWSLRPVLVYVASRVGMLLVAGAVGVDGHQPLSRSLTVWDSSWYLEIAKGGYVTRIPPGFGNSAQSDLGFFPLVPLLIRATHLVTGFGITVSGLVTTFLLGLGAAVAVWWMLRDVFGTPGADRGTALVFFSPGAVVLSLVYTEGATVLLVACVLMALRRERWVLAGVCAALAMTVDPVAGAVFVPCVVAAVVAVRRRGEWRALAAPVLAPLGVVAFFGYLWAHTGSPLEYFRAQRAGWQSGTFFGGIPTALGQLFAHGFGDINEGVKAVSILATVGLLVLFFRARPPATWIAYVVAVLVLAAVSPVIGVTPRLVLRGFPLLGVVGAKLPPLWFEAALGLSALCMAALGVLAMGGPLWTP